MTLTKDNYTELEDVTRIAEKNGFEGVVCNICAVEPTAVPPWS